jgi:hypothetical protein
LKQNLNITNAGEFWETSRALLQSRCPEIVERVTSKLCLKLDVSVKGASGFVFTSSVTSSDAEETPDLDRGYQTP